VLPCSAASRRASLKALLTSGKGASAGRTSAKIEPFTRNLTRPLRTSINFRPIALLLLLTIGAILVHGFHPYVEDSEIYVPSAKRALDPALYPTNNAFFLSHAHLTLFPNLIAESVRVTHLSWDWALFLWQFASIFLLLWACWRIGQLAFRDSLAAWGGAALVGALLTIPVAGTALYIMDQYVTTRALSTPATLWVIVNTIERRWVRAGFWLVFTVLIHPLMVVFCAAFMVLLVWLDRPQATAVEPEPTFVTWLLMPLGFFPPVTDAYREILQTRSYFLLQRWEWYEWVGIFAPLILLEWFRRIAQKRDLPVLARLCAATIIFGLCFFVAGVVVSLPALENFAELQPLRCLQLVYILLFLFAGGLLAQFVLKRAVWRWLVLFAPLCAGMLYAQRQLFPATAHVEWPHAASRNPWVQAFLWIRYNTPADAYFALDPKFMLAAEEDQHGFRAIANRSRMADRVKDSGAVSMFPQLAETWRTQVRSLDGWGSFKRQDFERLRQEYGVTWVVLQSKTLPDLPCPYQNSTVLVCRLDEGVASK